MTELAKQFSSEQLVRAIRLFNQAAFELRASAHPTLPLEVAFVEATFEAAPALRGSAPPAPRSVPPPPKPKTENHPPASAPAAKSVPPEKVDPNFAAAPGTLSVDTLRAGWRSVLTRVRPYDKMAEALLRDAEPLRVEGDLVVLGFYHQVHAERFEKQPNGKVLIEKALVEIFQTKCRVKCVLSPKKARLKAVEEDPLIRAAINQMGAEITEIHDQER
jgi:DNA polymerase-3 subunit gamma/tau